MSFKGKFKILKIAHKVRMKTNPVNNDISELSQIFCTLTTMKGVSV